MVFTLNRRLDHRSTPTQDFVGGMCACVCLTLPPYYEKIRDSQSCLQVSSNPAIMSVTQIFSNYFTWISQFRLFFLSLHHTFPRKMTLNFTNSNFVGVHGSFWADRQRTLPVVSTGIEQELNTQVGDAYSDLIPIRDGGYKANFLRSVIFRFFSVLLNTR